MSGRAEAPGCDSGTLVPRPCQPLSGRAEAPGCDSAPWCPPLPTPERAGGSPRLRSGTLVPTPANPRADGRKPPVAIRHPGAPPLPAASASRRQHPLPAGCRQAAHRALTSHFSLLTSHFSLLTSHSLLTHSRPRCRLLSTPYDLLSRAGPFTRRLPPGGSTRSRTPHRVRTSLCHAVSPVANKIPSPLNKKPPLPFRNPHIYPHNNPHPNSTRIEPAERLTCPVFIRRKSRAVHVAGQKTTQFPHSP
ncbi:MAG: hypothetical protein RLZZ436_1928 [Planctomycetota bacterium]